MLRFFIFTSSLLRLRFLSSAQHTMLELHFDYHFVKIFFSQATSDEEMTMWVKGLNWLVADTLKSPTPLQIER